MSYLSCTNCDFEQDDFWHKGGCRPIKRDAYEWYQMFQDGMSGQKIKIDPHEADIFGIKHEDGYADFRDVIAHELERKAEVFRSMLWVTEEDFRAADNPECPCCGSTKDWVIS